MSKFYIDQQKEETITEIVWVNGDRDEEQYIEEDSRYITICGPEESIGILKVDIPKLEAALAKARELGWFE